MHTAESSPSLESRERGSRKSATPLADRFAFWVGLGADPQHQQQQQQQATAENSAARSTTRRTKRPLRRQPTPPPPTPPRPYPGVVEITQRVVASAAPVAAADDTGGGGGERATESLSDRSYSPTSSSLDSFESTDGLLPFPTDPSLSSRPGEAEDGLDSSRGGGGGGGGTTGDGSRDGVLAFVADTSGFSEAELGGEATSGAEDAMPRALAENSADGEGRPSSSRISQGRVPVLRPSASLPPPMFGGSSDSDDDLEEVMTSLLLISWFYFFVSS